MATPVRQRHTLAGASSDILIDTLGSTDPAPRPAVVILYGLKGLEERLARAGFTAVSLLGSAVESADVETVIAALDRGGLGVPSPSSIGIVAHQRGGETAVLAAARMPRISALVTSAAIASGEVAAAAERVRIPWLRVQGTGTPDLERVVDQTTGWLLRHLT